MIARVRQHAYPWWLWPNILSLDAPLITLVWQLWFSKCFEVVLDVDSYLILFLTVWLIYSLDRWLDAWKLDINKPHSIRHRFYLDYRWSVAGVWIFILLIAMLILTQISIQVITRGFWVLAACAMYFLLLHKLGWKALPKEILVGVIVSLGVTLCLWQIGFALLLPAVGFALLITLNCLVIGLAEETFDRSQQYYSMIEFMGQRGVAVVLTGLLFLVLILGRGHFFYFPVLLTIFGLWGLKHIHSDLTTTLGRVLADAFLLSPLLVYFVV